MSYPSTVDTGQVQPWVITSEAAALFSTSNTLGANSVYLFAFEVNVNVVISGIRIRIGNSGGTTDLGIYDSGGNKLVSTGAVTNVISTTMTNTFSSNYSLGPGQYFLALCPSNNTDTYQRVSGAASTSPDTRFRLAVNAGTLGVLPATTGGTAATTICPMMAAMVVGGLS